MGNIEYIEVDKKDSKLYKQVLALRYRVYCEQRRFERPEDHKDGLERDLYDEHAVHFAAILKKTQEVIGTIRLILKSPEGFPIEKHFKFSPDITVPHKEYIAEVSRLAIDNGYLQKWARNQILRSKFSRGHWNSKDDDPVFGLIRCIAKASGELGISHWYAVMAKPLFTILKRKNVVFPCVGPEIDFHGKRGPYFGEIEDILSGNDELFHAFVTSASVEEAWRINCNHSSGGNCSWTSLSAGMACT